MAFIPVRLCDVCLADGKQVPAAGDMKVVVVDAEGKKRTLTVDVCADSRRQVEVHENARTRALADAQKPLATLAKRIDAASEQLRAAANPRRAKAKAEPAPTPGDSDDQGESTPATPSDV